MLINRNKKALGVLIFFFFLNTVRPGISSELASFDSFSIDSSLSELNVPLNKIIFADSLNGMLSAYWHSLNVPCFFKSEDGGRKWELAWKDSATVFIDSATGKKTWSHFPGKCYDMTYPNESCLFAVCGNDYFMPYLIKYSGKMNEWKTVELHDSEFYKRIIMFDEVNGYLLSQKSLYSTKDSGNNWVEVINSNEIGNISFNDLNLVNNEKLLILGNSSDFSTYLISYDLLSKKYDWFKTENLKSMNIRFFNDLLGWAFTLSRSSDLSLRTDIYGTIDGGRNWTCLIDTNKAEMNPGIINDLIVLDSSNIAIFGFDNTIYFSIDGGNTWSQYENIPKLNEIPLQFIDAYYKNKNEIFALTAGRPKICRLFKSTSSIEDFTCIHNLLFISPNPATDFIEISLGAHQAMPIQIKIYDVFGREVNIYLDASDTPPNPLLLEGEQIRIDVSNLTPGLYFVRVGGRVGKFLKI